jgi:hypothetical protein
MYIYIYIYIYTHIYVYIRIYRSLSSANKTREDRHDRKSIVDIDIRSSYGRIDQDQMNTKNIINDAASRSNINKTESKSTRESFTRHGYESNDQNNIIDEDIRSSYEKSQVSMYIYMYIYRDEYMYIDEYKLNICVDTIMPIYMYIYKFTQSQAYNDVDDKFFDMISKEEAEKKHSSYYKVNNEGKSTILCFDDFKSRKSLPILNISFENSTTKDKIIETHSKVYI